MLYKCFLCVVLCHIVNDGAKLHNKFYTTTGNGTAVLSAKAFADEYAQKLIADGVDAVIMTST